VACVEHGSAYGDEVLGLLVAAATAAATGLLLTPYLIAKLRAANIGQLIQEEVGQHAAKAGTPTMGGLVIAAALVVGYAAGHLALRTRPSRTGVLVVAAIIGASIVGGIDEWLKIRHERNLGLRERQKTIGLLIVAVAFVVLHRQTTGSCDAIALTRCHGPGLRLGPVVWSLFAVGLLWVTANAANFTDGLEGLLAGSGAMSYAALAVIAFWQFRHVADYGVRDALDLALVAGAAGAGCIGFLWWNANPMTIFMGDVGSLALGMGIAALTISMNVALLVPVLGVLYVAEGGSSFLQRWWFRISGGRRLFRMAPIHHHFELLWPESTVIVRFWIVSGLGAALALAIFYGDFLRVGGK
jgi:phospho-N-acetylmuramoyl-pentapeptide-transferase